MLIRLSDTAWWRRGDATGVQTREPSVQLGGQATIDFSGRSRPATGSLDATAQSRPLPLGGGSVYVNPMLSADEVIATLDLAPHPEGGYYRETFRDPREVNGRSVGTAIYYLLTEGEGSRWHVVDAAELWHFYDGAPLELRIADGPERRIVLGEDMRAGQRPQAVVPTGAWQAARSLGAWSLVGCTVAPGFDFAGFEVAPAGWSPPVA